jgi:hypothetical protein
MIKQIVQRFEEEQEDKHISFIRITLDTQREDARVVVESGSRAEYFNSIDEAEQFYQSYVDFIKKVKKLPDLITIPKLLSKEIYEK